MAGRQDPGTNLLCPGRRHHFGLFASPTPLVRCLLREKLPFLNQFFQASVANVGLLTNAAKAYYHRPRPYVLDAEIHRVVPKPGNDSYPSGHSTAGHFFAIILADMVPEKATELYARGDSFAMNRVIGGGALCLGHRGGEVECRPHRRKTVHEC